MTDSGAHFYEVYECADGRYVSVAAIEAKFYAELLRLLEIDPATMPLQMDRARWPEAKARLAERFRTRTRDEWCALLEGTDACFAPVLSMEGALVFPFEAEPKLANQTTAQLARARPASALIRR